jgi:hypothetical protein
MLYLTGSFWKAILVGMSVLVACFVGIGPRGSFAVAVAAIASCSALRALINGCSCGGTPDKHSPIASLAKSPIAVLSGRH